MTDEIQPPDPRQAAIRRIKARRDYWRHLAIYLMINGIFIAIWATGGQGYFWPAWVLIGWGIGLVFHTWDVFGRPISEEDIRKEMNRRSHA